MHFFKILAVPVGANNNMLTFQLKNWMEIFFPKLLAIALAQENE
jgi:hypothetical protein